jgi:hypothetical protein
MKVAFILLSLFSLSVSLEMDVIDLGQKIEFDSFNNNFKIAYKGPQKNLFLTLITHDKENLGYHIICPYNKRSTSYIKEKAYGFIFSIYAGECEFTLDVDEGDKGSFIIYDFRALYEIKLKNIYGNTKIYLKYSNLHDEEIGLANKLTFLVPNFRTNSTITFEYKESVVQYEKFQNPFKVCHKNVCKENITSYYFEKGKSYQIYVKLLKVLEHGTSTTYDYVVPPFSFYAEDSDKEYSNDDIKYTYEEIQPSSSNYRQMSILILVLLTSLLF